MKVTVICILPEDGPCEMLDMAKAIARMVRKYGILPRHGDSLSADIKGTTIRLQRTGEFRKLFLDASMEVNCVIIFPELDAVSITLEYPEGKDVPKLREYLSAYAREE